MTARQWMTGGALAALAAAAVAGLVMTRNPAPPPAEGDVAQGSKKPGAQKPGARPRRAVDMTPLLVARRMAALAATPEEQELARQAERAADHSVDLAFAEALRTAAEEEQAPSPELAPLVAARQKAQQRADAEQRHLEELQRQLAAATGSEKERLGDQVEVARAQLELAQDDRDGAAETLERAGGDPQARIRRNRAAYEAAQKEPRPVPPPPADPDSVHELSLLARLRAWTGARGKVAQLVAAQQEAQERGQRLAKRREVYAQRVQEGLQARAAAERAVESIGAGAAAHTSREEAQAAVAALKRFTVSQRKLNVVGQRVQYQQELAEAYGIWSSVAMGQRRAALHRVLEGTLWVFLTLLATFAAGQLVDRLFHGMAREQLRMGTLRTVVKFAVQLVGLLVILFIAFGAPSQATTVLGLAGAGLTVAMKDFIVAFFGWFVLMRRNGIRVGDWVEIRGVGGEVVEIGLLHTVLLETGSFGDAGHPTGRRVSFVNSFAIEGHYFNFSTTGQWMWDELRVTIPSGQDPYPIIDGIQKLVEEETEANTRLAEQEWRKATTRYRVKTFSAVPGVSVVPAAGGVEVRVRYITRAHERHQTRRALSGAVVELLHGKRVQGTVAAEPAT